MTTTAALGLVLGAGFPGPAATAAPATQATQVTLHVPASVAGPYRAAEAIASVKPATGNCPFTWKLQRYTGRRWVNVFDPSTTTEGCEGPEIAYAWSRKPGRMKLRAYVPAQGLLRSPGYSAVVTVKVGKARPPRWLTRLNRLRALNKAPAVPLDAKLDAGARHHARYMYHNHELVHVENPRNKWYTPDGNAAGQAGDEAIGADPITEWAKTAYHQNMEIDPAVAVVGYGTVHFYASLTAIWNVAYKKKGPYFEFPAAGKTTWLTKYLGGETPDPVAHCPSAWRKRLSYWGYSLGLPMEFSTESDYNLVGRQPKRVTATLRSGGKRLRMCTFHDRWSGVTYMLPLLPLKHGRHYTVSVTYDHKLKAKWKFRVSK